MSSAEFTEWMLYFQIEPFGAVRDNAHAGLIASTVANCHSKRKFKYSDFMFTDPEDRKKAETKNVLAWMQSVAKPASG